MKYKILFDYGSEGMSFWTDDIKKDGFDSVDEAVKHAISLCTGRKFLIVQVIDWQAQQAK